MRTPFRERNPAPIALIGFAVIGVCLLVAMNLGSIPFFNGQRSHTAYFVEAGGLRSGEEVRIAGVKVGQVTGLDLDGERVKVTFRVDNDVKLGNTTRAEIKIKTMLGAHFLALDPRGTGELARPIGTERTTVPYEVVPAIEDLSRQVGQIDHKQVARSFDTLTAVLANSPEEIRGSLKGLQRLSKTVASRDDELNQLLDRTKNVSQLLADRNKDFERLVQDGDKLLQAIRARRDVIHQLLVNTVLFSQQVNALINENNAQLKPMLKNLQGVSQVLLKNQKNLERTLELFAPFARQFTDVTGTGRWFDSWIQNLIPIPASIGEGPGQQTKAQERGSAEEQQKRQQQQSPQQPGSPNNPLPFLP